MWIVYLGDRAMANFSTYAAAEKWAAQFGNKFEILEVPF